MIELTPKNFFSHAHTALGLMLLKQDPQERAKIYTDVMNKAREFDLEEETEKLAQRLAEADGETAELWELPQSFERNVVLQPFPLSCLPSVLQEFLKAVSEYVQVFPEMAVLPLLSVLSLCVQGKAVIKHPGNDHTENLNLYTLTIASPGERKSGSFKEFMRPVEAYQENYNTIHEVEIEQYKTEKAFLERQKQAAMIGKNASIEKAKKITHELLELEEKHELRLNVNDVTPEALAWEMYLQGGKIGVVDDEGSVFDVLSGLYSGGTVNINIFLKAYDGSNYTIVRRTKERIDLKKPLLTVGLMVQPSHFDEAMNNKQFSGRGFIYRFLFAFPESKAGSRKFTSDNIPIALQNQYSELITRLLRMKTPKEPHILTCNKNAFNIFKDYFDYIELRMKQGGQFEYLKEWANKQFARCLKIAGILHLCEHEPTEQVDEQTALNAVNIAVWSENHAIKALSGEMTDSEETRNAKYILSKLKRSESEILTKHEFLIRCRPLKAEECEKPLELLEDMNVIKRTFTTNGKKGKPKENIKINPLIF